jgi:hypothetical protein
MAQHIARTPTPPTLAQIGQYAFVRMLRNNGVTFEDAYRTIFGRAPRHTAHGTRLTVLE